jgi:hypothetical protein
MKGMVDDFEAVLRDEISSMMMDKVRRRKVRRPSEQSTSAASTGSHKNDAIPPQIRGRAHGVGNINYTTAVDD